MQDYIPERPVFDELKRLAKEDPEALESIRQQHVKHIISNAPDLSKLA